MSNEVISYGEVVERLKSDCIPLDIYEKEMNERRLKMTEISLDKKYRTKNKCEINILSHHPDQIFCYIGEYEFSTGRWYPSSWSAKGTNISRNEYLDLIEVKEPQYAYLNVYKELCCDKLLLFDEEVGNSREIADERCEDILDEYGYLTRVGCLKVPLEERFDD